MCDLLQECTSRITYTHNLGSMIPYHLRNIAQGARHPCRLVVQCLGTHMQTCHGVAECSRSFYTFGGAATC